MSVVIENKNAVINLLSIRQKIVIDMALKKYSFEIRSPKNYQDKKSPHTLSKFEFLAENKQRAEVYRKKLIDNYDVTTLIDQDQTIPIGYTDLTEMYLE